MVSCTGPMPSKALRMERAMVRKDSMSCDASSRRAAAFDGFLYVGMAPTMSSPSSWVACSG